MKSSWFFILIVLMLLSYIGTLCWRRIISKKHTEFKTRMDLASDEEHARRLHQQALQKRGIK